MTRWELIKRCLIGRNFIPKLWPTRSSRGAVKMTNKLLSNKVYLQVLGTASGDTTPSLLLFTDSQRYLFNCGEGTQRLFNEQKVRYNKLNNIFFTQICWENIGGLPGMAMTLRDNGRAKLGLYGPASIKDFIKATRFFLFHEKLHFDCVEYTEQSHEEFVDENLTIIPVVLQGRADKGKAMPTGHQASNPEIVSSDNNITSPTKKMKLCLYPTNGSVVCYICKLVSVPGKFLLQKAKELGVPKGPLYGKLKNGEAVVLSDGTKILPEQVTELPTPGPILLIISCPSTEFIASLVENESLAAYHEGVVEGAVSPCLVVHLTPMEVFNQPSYVAWRERYGSKTEHLLINKDVCSDTLVFRRQASIQCKLHTLDHDIFPLLYNSSTPPPSSLSLPAQTKAGEYGLQFHMRPAKQQGYDKSNVPEPLDIQAIMSEAKTAVAETHTRDKANATDELYSCKETLHCGEEEHLAKKAEDNKTVTDISEQDKLQLGCYNKNANLKDEDAFMGVGSASTSSGINVQITSETVSLNDTADHVNHSNNTMNIDSNHRCGCHDNSPDGSANHGNNKGDIDCSDCCHDNTSSVEMYDFQVVFIGTGASLPSKYRNVSATLLNISDQTSILLDCGEGTLGQLYRHYGNITDDVIRRIKCVFISHIHADHHLGLLRVLLHKAELDKSGSRLESPILVIGPTKMRFWLQEYSSLCEHLEFRFMDCAPSNVSDSTLLSILEAQKLAIVPVDHCPFAYGLVLSHVTGWKVVYSGDTRPCDRLITAGSGATLLIHEATFEDELKSEAIDKKHSTTTEAITSGLGMSARFIMLNHFSQRYPKIPVFSEKFTKHTGIAFDHMTVRPRDFNKIASFLAPLRVLFAEEVVELTQNTETRRNKLNNKQ